MANPLDLVRNPATQSTIHDVTKAKEAAESDARRAKLDQMRTKERALKRSPVAGEHARLHTHSLGGLGSHAVVVLKIVHKDKSTRTFEICELSVDSDGLSLFMVCPSCLFRHGRGVGQSHVTMRSWHRKFVLDHYGAGELWVNPEDPAEIVTIAGTIETEEPQTCPVCSFRYEIEKSRDPKEKGISVVREV